MKNQKETIRKILLYIRHYWWLILGSLLCAAVSVVFTLYLPILTGYAVDVMVEKASRDQLVPSAFPQMGFTIHQKPFSEVVLKIYIRELSACLYFL